MARARPLRDLARGRLVRGRAVARGDVAPRPRLQRVRGARRRQREPDLAARTGTCSRSSSCCCARSRSRGWRARCVRCSRCVTLVLCQRGVRRAGGGLGRAARARSRSCACLPRGFFRNVVRVGYGATRARRCCSSRCRSSPISCARAPPAARRHGRRLDARRMSRRQRARVRRTTDAGRRCRPAPASPAPQAAEEHAAGSRRRPARPWPTCSAAAAGSRRAPSATRRGDKRRLRPQGRLGAATARALQQDPEATVQTGPGVPTWRWRSWQLELVGPRRQARTRRAVSDPAAARTACCRCCACSCSALLIVVLLRSATPGPRQARRERAGSGRPQPAPRRRWRRARHASLLALLRSPPARSGARRLPDQALLDQLRARLTKPRRVPPRLRVDRRAALDVGARELRLTSRVHARRPTSVRAARPGRELGAGERALDGRTDAPLVLRHDGFLHVRVEPGVHVIELRWAAAAAPTRSRSPCPTSRTARACAPRASRSTACARTAGRAGAAAQPPARGRQRKRRSRAAALPPLLAARAPASSSARAGSVHNRLARVSPPGTPDPRARAAAARRVGHRLGARGGRRRAAGRRSAATTPRSSGARALADRATSSSSSPRPDSRAASAGASLCGPIWHCDTRGLTPFAQRATTAVYEPSFAPWPGERARARVSRGRSPRRVSRSRSTRARLDVTPGVRMRKAELQLRPAHAAAARAETLELPKGARVQQQTIDGAAASDPSRGHAPQLHARARARTTCEVQWQEPVGMGFVEAVAPLVLQPRRDQRARHDDRAASIAGCCGSTGPAFGSGDSVLGLPAVRRARGARCSARAPHQPAARARVAAARHRTHADPRARRAVRGDLVLRARVPRAPARAAALAAQPRPARAARAHAVRRSAASTARCTRAC